MTTTKSVTPTANVEPAAAKVEPVPNKVEPAAVKVEPLASGRPAETSGQLIARAKTTIAARLDDPRSAEFGEMKRAMRKNTLGKSVDTNCRYVKGKKASGESTGDTPFLYVVMADLTPRQQHVFASLKLGLPSNLIAVRLNLFENIVEMHTQHILRKMLRWN
jgi:DNA-binding CsgD family transcriptional regulator